MNDPAALITSTLGMATAPCLTCSFQAEDVVVLHMLRQIRPGVPVLFLDTVHHFAETYAYRDRLAKQWNLALVTLRAERPVPALWQTSTNECCALHKVAPLFSALETYDMWFTGLRREQSPSRSGLQEVEEFRLPSGKLVAKVSPLAAWTTAQVREYAQQHELPLLPLYNAGYSSIGCEPCTRLPTDPANPRSGRWHGEKLECGIHLQPASELPAV